MPSPSSVSPEPRPPCGRGTFRRTRANSSPTGPHSRDFSAGRFTLQAVVKQPEIQQLGVVRAQADPAAWLEDNLRVSFDAPELMRVEIDGEPVDELRTILDALAKVYLADVDARDNGARRERLRKLEETYRTYRAELERFQKRITDIATSSAQVTCRCWRPWTPT